MRALVVLVLLAGVAMAGPVGFDHVVHDRNVVVNGGDSIPCGRCHDKGGKLLAKPGHAACFGACHGPLPGKAPVGDRTKVCTNCHEEASLTSKKPPANYTVESDFNVSFGHKQHAAVACSQCHDMREKATKPATHARCASCHDGAKGHGPPMAKCTSCHPTAVGKPEPPALAAVQNTVTSTFSHPKHATRGTLGKECTTCHAAIRETDDTQLPRPQMQGCALGGCHDAKAAFPTTGSCVRCHERAPDRFDVWRPEARFTHSSEHAQAVQATPCKTCHVLTPAGEARPAGHAPCVQCHADDFAARQPKICGACHNATEPWRHLVADRAPPPRTEFGAMLDHDKHKTTCTNCHALRTDTAELRTPRGHAACTGKTCHAVSTGAAPHLDDCKACHELGLADARLLARKQAPWSVRAAFEHATHAKTQDGNPLACSVCHTTLNGTNLVELATPQKPTCLPCHDDGKGAFKLTGTTCKRCHGVQ